MTTPRILRGTLLGACLAIVSCSRDTSPPTVAAPPVTRIATVIDRLHGVEIADHYRWLEENTAEVAAWADAQNRYTRSVLDGLPARKRLEDHLRPLVQIGSMTAPIVRGNRYFYARRAASQKQPIVLMRDGALGSERVLVDATKLEDEGGEAATWLSPSHDGKLLAYGTALAGGLVARLRVLDVARAKPLADEIANVLEGVQWLPDGSGFIYHSLKDSRDPSSRQGLFHRLGTASASDAILYRHVTAAENPRVARAGGPSGALSRDGRWFVLSYWLDPESTDVWLANFEEFRRKGARAARAVSIGVPGRAYGRVIGDMLFLHTTKGAPRGRVIATSTAQPDQKHWREIVPERPDAIESVAFGLGTIAVTYAKNSSTVIEVFDFNGLPLGTLQQPGLGSVQLSASEDRTEAYLTFASFNYPSTVFRVDLRTPGASPQYWSGPDVPVEPSSLEVRQVSYGSSDGTKITMFLVHKKSLARDGNTPTLLTGYGAFGVSMVPTFAAPFLRWFEAGGVLAVPHLRGGGEYGEAWHRAGMLDKKQNGINDFIAAAEWLVANKYTNPQKLATLGLSDGGLIVGAALTTRPDLFRAAVLGTPLLDMLRYHRFAREPYRVAEYGSADDARQFSWLLEYSPYQRLKVGTSYPAVLLTAIDGEAEVSAFHARKMAAALQAVSGPDGVRRPVLLRVDRPPQGPMALFDTELRDIVDQQVFLMWQLGMR